MEAKIIIDRLTVNNVMNDLYAGIEDRYEVQIVEKDYYGDPTHIYLWDPNCASKATVHIHYLPFKIEIQTAMSGFKYQITEIGENKFELHYNGAYRGLGMQQLLPPTIENALILQWEDIKVKSSTSTEWVDISTYELNRQN